MEAGAGKSTRYELTTTHFVSNLMGSVQVYVLIDLQLYSEIVMKSNINLVKKELRGKEGDPTIKHFSGKLCHKG